MIKNQIDKSGFTEKEKLVHDRLMDSYNAFLALDIQHPSEQAEFAFAVHIIQGILTTRIARRCYPDGWPTYKETK